MTDVTYCPACGSELETTPAFGNGGWFRCPDHGDVHIEYFPRSDSE